MEATAREFVATDLVATDLAGTDLLSAGDLGTILFVLQLCATGYMIGVIWTVQLVHYPLFRAVSQEAFPAFEREHQMRMSRVVMPFMLAELASATALPWIASPQWTSAEAWLGLVLLVIVWVSTFAVQVPAHQRLRLGFDAKVHRRLVRSNWLRTALWTLRGLLVIVWLIRGLRDS